MALIFVPYSAKRITIQILVTERLNRKKIILRDFVYNIIRPSKELLVQS